MFLDILRMISKHWFKWWICWIIEVFWHSSQGNGTACAHDINPWINFDNLYWSWYHIDGLVQERCNFIANTLELYLSCTNASTYPIIQWLNISLLTMASWEHNNNTQKDATVFFVEHVPFECWILWIIAGWWEKMSQLGCNSYIWYFSISVVSG